MELTWRSAYLGLSNQTFFLYEGDNYIAVVVRGSDLYWKWYYYPFKGVYQPFMSKDVEDVKANCMAVVKDKFYPAAALELIP